MWTKAGSVTKCSRIQTNPDTCGQGLDRTGQTDGRRNILLCNLGAMYSDQNDVCGVILSGEARPAIWSCYANFCVFFEHKRKKFLKK